MNTQSFEEQKTIVTQTLRAIDAYVKLEFKDKPELNTNEVEEICREIKNAETNTIAQEKIKSLILKELDLFKNKISHSHIQKIIKFKIEKEMIQRELIKDKEEIAKLENNLLYKLVGISKEKAEELKRKIKTSEISLKTLNDRYYTLKNGEPVANEKEIIMFKMNIQKMLFDQR